MTPLSQYVFFSFCSTTFLYWKILDDQLSWFCIALPAYIKEKRCSRPQCACFHIHPFLPFPFVVCEDFVSKHNTTKTKQKTPTYILNVNNTIEMWQGSLGLNRVDLSSGSIVCTRCVPGFNRRTQIYYKCQNF